MNILDMKLCFNNNSIGHIIFVGMRCSVITVATWVNGKFSPRIKSAGLKC